MIVFTFIAGLAVIAISSELFTNAVEWAGFRLHLGDGATGSLLAAFGTSLPETFVPIVALVSAQPSAAKIATGAVLGSSFLLLTLGVAITGIAVLGRRSKRALEVSPGQARRDLGTFCVAFSLVVLATLFNQPMRYGVGIILAAIYLAYVIATLRSGTPSEKSPEPLHLLRYHHRGVDPIHTLVVLQLLVAIGGLILGSKLFVDGIDQSASALHFDPLILALVLVPVATELPETINSVLWVRSNDDGLAFGNVAGSATFQACILGFVGVTFTPWRPGVGGMLGAGLTLLTGVYLLWLLRRGRAHGRWLLLAAVPWMSYVALMAIAGGHLGATTS